MSLNTDLNKTNPSLTVTLDYTTICSIWKILRFTLENLRHFNDTDIDMEGYELDLKKIQEGNSWFVISKDDLDGLKKFADKLSKGV